jgi:hypothetical protein
MNSLPCLSRLALLVLALALAAAVDARSRLPDEAVLLDALPPAALAEAERVADAVDRLLQAGQPAAARARLAALSDPLLAEAAADRLIDRLRRRAPDAAGSELLAWLASWPERVFRRHEETAGDWFVPVFAVAQRADGTLEAWRREQERSDWRERLARDPGAAIVALAAAAADQHQRAAEAAMELDDAAIARLLGAARAAPERLPADLWAALAEHSGDPQAVAEVLARGSQAQQLALIAAAPQRLPPLQAEALLERAGRQPALASAATLALATLAASHPPAAELLATRLDDAELGPSAAAGLARMPDEDRVARIGRLLGAAPSALTARHLVLALRLEGSPQAVELLQRWASDPRLPAELRQEIAR